MMDSGEIKKIAIKFIAKFVTLNDNDAPESEFEKLRQIIREEYPLECRSILLAVRVYLDEYIRNVAI